MIGGPVGPRIRKVLMTTDAVGGVWTYGVDLADVLSGWGVEVVLAVVGPAPSRAQRAQTFCEVIETGLTLDWMAGSAAKARASARDLAALSRKVAPDLVHLNGPAMAAGGDFGAPVLGACHSCPATWWMAVKPDRALPRDLVWRRALQAEGMQRCDGLIAPSNAFARVIAETYGKRPKVVRNGRHCAAARLSAPGEDVFTAGRLWDQGKNLKVLDEAARLAGLPVKAAGSLQGPAGETIRLDHLSTLGALSSEQVRMRLSKRPIFVSTALYEPFGLAALEAAQAGCPLVLSDIPTFRELWSGAALFVDPRDAADIAETLVRLSRNGDERKKLGAAARARAATYTLEAMGAATLEAYRQIVGVPAEAAA